MDFSACVGCHSNKSEAPVVHAAVALGCNSCHAVDQDEDWTEVFLVTEGNALCFTCHSDKQPQPAQLAVHQPVRRQTCVTCHDPHTSQAPHLLRRPEEGREATENLCLGCHQNIASQLKKSTQHAAVDLGCSSCHTTHKSEPPNAPEGMFHLTQGLPELCLTCHDAGEKSFGAAHSNQPAAGSRCTECHNPHGSDAPKLINNFIHAPFQMGCETCHAEPKDRKVILQEGAGRAMCLTCHADVEEQMAQAKFVHPALKVDPGCVGCHSPHAASYRHQLRQDPVRTCLACHPDLAQARADKQHLHRPAFETGCTVCHQPHTSEHAQLLRADVNDLCLECHAQGTTRAVQIRSGASLPVALFGGSVEAPTGLFNGIRVIPMEKGQEKGHPIPFHPVTGKYPLGGNMSCTTCHLPHAADRTAQFFVTEAPGQSDLCKRCH